MGFNEGPTLVVTTASQIIPERLVDTAPIPDDIFNLIPQEIREDIPDGVELIVAPVDALLEDGKALVVIPGDDGGISHDDVVSTVFSVGSIFVPGLAAWEGLLALFIKRKRDNYKKAARAVAPKAVSGYSTNWAEFATAISAALLGTHSTEDGEVALDEELAAKE